MRISHFVAAVTIVALAGCATGNRFKPFVGEVASTARASVSVVGDQVIVSAEPIYVQQADGNTLYWYLDPYGPYYFPDTDRDKGIDFSSPKPPGLRCNADPHDTRTFICTYNRANKAKYPYTIKVTKDGTNILKSDPTVYND